MREQALQESLEKAVEIPYSVAKEVNRLWPTLVQLARVCNLGTVSDLQVGCILQLSDCIFGFKSCQSSEFLCSFLPHWFNCLHLSILCTEPARDVLYRVFVSAQLNTSVYNAGF
jgi:hypothetical protein